MIKKIRVIKVNLGFHCFHVFLLGSAVTACEIVYRLAVDIFGVIDVIYECIFLIKT